MTGQNNIEELKEELSDEHQQEVDDLVEELLKEIGEDCDSDDILTPPQMLRIIAHYQGRLADTLSNLPDEFGDVSNLLRELASITRVEALRVEARQKEDDMDD